METLTIVLWASIAIIGLVLLVLIALSIVYLIKKNDKKKAAEKKVVADKKAADEAAASKLAEQKKKDEENTTTTATQGGAIVGCTSTSKTPVYANPPPDNLLRSDGKTTWGSNQPYVPVPFLLNNKTSKPIQLGLDTENMDTYFVNTGISGGTVGPNSSVSSLDLTSNTNVSPVLYKGGRFKLRVDGHTVGEVVPTDEKMCWYIITVEFVNNSQYEITYSQSSANYAV